MTAAELLTHLRRQGMEIRPHGRGISVQPRELLTSAVRDALREQRLEVLDILHREASLRRRLERRAPGWRVEIIDGVIVYTPAAVAARRAADERQSDTGGLA